MTTRSLPFLLLAAAAGLSCSQQDFVTDVPLRVVSISPTQGSVTTAIPTGSADGGVSKPVVDTYVPREASFDITFSERLLEDSVQDAFTLEALGPAGTDPATATPTALKATVTYQESPVPTVTVTPESKLPFSTAVRLTLATSLKRLRDRGPLPVQVRWLATTVHPPALRVVSILPANGAAAQPRDAQLKVVFNEPVDCASAQAGMTVSELADPHPHTAAGATAVAVPGTWECPVVAADAEETLEGTWCTRTADKCTLAFKPTGTAFRFKYSSEATLQVAGGDAAAPVKSARATQGGGKLAENVGSSFRVVDPPALALATAVPANGATGVERSTTLAFDFTEPVDCETLTAAGAVTVSQVVDNHPRFGTRAGKTESVSGGWACPTVPPSAGEGEAACAADPAHCRAVFQPDAGFAFEFSANARVDVVGGAYDAGVAPTTRDRVESLRATTRGGQLQGDVTFQVRAVDPAPLAVTASSPGNQAGNVPVSPPPSVQVQFSRKLACDSATASTASASVTRPDGTTTPWPLTVQCNAGDDHLTLLPQSSKPLDFSSTVKVTLKGGPYVAGARVLEAEDASTRGGQLPANVTLEFDTEEPPSLLLASALPSPGSTGSGLSEPITLSFSEKVDCNSINAGSVLVRQTPAPLASGAPVPAASDVACTFTCEVGGDVRKVQCAHAPFSPSATVEVRLAGGLGLNTAIRSAAATPTGGQLPANVTWTYRAADPAPLAVVGTSPNGNPGNNVSANTDIRFTFSRPVRCSTVAGRLKLQRDDTGATVPGTLTCTNGTLVGPTVDGTVAIFTPSMQLEVLKLYRATAQAGIEALDASLLGTAAQGTLPSDVSTTFKVAFEELEVLSSTPVPRDPGALIGTKVVLRFNQEVAPSSLVPCTPSSDKSTCNVVITRGASPFNWTSGTLATTALDVDGAPTYEGGTRKWTLDPSDSLNAPLLAVSTTYSVSIKGGPSGPLGANGVSKLPLDYAFSFTTSDDSDVGGTEPDRNASDVEANNPVCVTFVADVDVASLTAGGNQLSLTYTDAFGRTAALPLDAANPYTVSPANRVCMNLVNSPYACGPGVHRLRPGTAYSATVNGGVKVGTTALGTPFSWAFTTRSPTTVSGVRVANAVISEPLVDGALEVPVNGAFTITFSEPMAAASLTNANVRLVRLGTPTEVVATTVTQDGLADPLAVTLTTSGLSHKSASADGRYAVELLGGTGGVTTKNGHTLATDIRVAFTTSPATTVTFSPAEPKLEPGVLIPLVTDRALHLPSVTSETLFATRNGTRINGIVALQSAQPRAATYIPNPTWLTNNAGPYVIQTSAGMLDHRGNPVPVTASRDYQSGTASASNSIQPSLIDGSKALRQVANSQSFVLTMPGTGLKERTLSTSWYSTPPTAPQGSISLESEGTPDPRCPAKGVKLNLESILVPGTVVPQLTADEVSIKVVPLSGCALQSACYMVSGCQYRLTVRQAQAANLYNQGNQGGDLSLIVIGGQDIRGEAQAPTLPALEVQKTDGTFTALTGSSTASGRVVVRATFSEPVAADSVTDISFRVSGSVSLPATWSVSGNVVTWTANALVPAGTTLTAALGNGITDLAGNKFAGTTQSFTVESATPTFTAVTWDEDATREAPYGVATLTFSEPVAPKTLNCNTDSALGSVSLKAGSTKLFGCAVLSGTNPNEVLWRPAEPLGTAVTVDVTVNPAGVVTALEDLAGTPVPLTTHPFTTP